MFPYLSFLGLALPIPPLTLLIGTWFGSSLAEKNAPKHKVDPEQLYNLIFIALTFGVIGARLAYLIRYPSAFLDNPRSIISLNFGLFDPVGGALSAALTAVVFGQRKHLELWPVLDALTPAIAVLILAVPIANFASGAAYGAPTQLPWGVELWGQNRHPVQLYEALGAGLILYLLWPSRQPDTGSPGRYFLQFVAYSAISRLLFEAFRGSSLVTLWNIRTSQLAAWLILAAALWGFARLNPNMTSETK